MHICPFLISLVPITDSTWRADTAPGVNTAGHLPPSSKVTGVRFRAAAAMTCLPIAALPVYRRRSHGNDEKSRAKSWPPTTTDTSVESKVVDTMSRSSAEQAGVYSDGLMMTRLPAANISIRGPIERSKGKFQGTILPMTPLGW